MNFFFTVNNSAHSEILKRQFRQYAMRALGIAVESPQPHNETLKRPKLIGARTWNVKPDPGFYQPGNAQNINRNNL
jgi:hypothetical protein